VGSGFRDDVLDMLAEKGRGAYVYLGSDAVVDRMFGAGFESLTRTVADDVQIALDLPDALGMLRFHGEEASTDPADVQRVQYGAGTSQVFLQDLYARESELAPTDELVLTITWRNALTGEPDAQRFAWPVHELVGADARNLTKAQALMAWSDVLIDHAFVRTPCGEPLAAYLDAASALPDDAELAYTTRLVREICPPSKRERPPSPEGLDVVGPGGSEAQPPPAPGESKHG
jgi:hypothetical protein